MNKYEVRAILMSASVLSVFFFAILYNTFARKIDVPVCIPYNASFEKSAVTRVDESRYEVYVIAKMWRFDPGEVKIPAGSTVDFFLTSADVVHGFHIERKAVNLMAVPGAVNLTTVTFEEPGEYRVVCHEYCGVGHQNMMGKILVSR